MNRLMAIAVVMTNALFGTRAALRLFKWWCDRIVPPPDPCPLCPVCGKPAPERAWCSQECEDFDTTGEKPK